MLTSVDLFSNMNGVMDMIRKKEILNVLRQNAVLSHHSSGKWQLSLCLCRCQALRDHHADGVGRGCWEDSCRADAGCHQTFSTAHNRPFSPSPSVLKTSWPPRTRILCWKNPGLFPSGPQFVCRRQAERVTPWTMSMAPCGIHRLCLRGDSEVLHHRLPVAVTPSPDIAPAVPGRS